MDYHLFGFSKPIDYDERIEPLKLSFMRLQLSEEGHEAIETFVRFTAANPALDISEPVDLAKLAKHSSDAILVPKLCSLGILHVKDGKLHVNWSEESASNAIAHHIAHKIDEESLTVPDGVELARRLDQLLETRLFLPIKWAFFQAHKKPELVQYCISQVKTFFPEQFYTGHTIEGSSSDPEYPWDQQLGHGERDYHRRKVSENERRLIFCLEMLHHLSPDFSREILPLANTPLQFLILLRRIDIADQYLYREPVRSKADSFLGFAITSFVTETYGRWIHEAHAWRTAFKKEELPSSLELLKRKATLDATAIRLALSYINSLPRPLDGKHVHAALCLIDSLLGSMKIRWQVNSYDTEGLSAPLFDALALQLSSRVDTEGAAVKSGVLDYLTKERNLDDRLATVARIGLSSASSESIKALLLDAIVHRSAAFLSSPFVQYPNFFAQQKQQFDANLRWVGLFILQHERAAQQLLELLDTASVIALAGPENDFNKNYNRVETCAYFSRIFLLGDINHLPPGVRDKATSILRKCHNSCVKSASTFGAGVGLTDLFVKQGVLAAEEQDRPHRWSDEEVQKMPVDRKKHYARFLIEQGDYQESKRLLETSEREAWDKGHNPAGQTSEAVYHWMLSLALLPGTTEAEYAQAVHAFERNRNCVGVDPESAYTLASVMAERSKQFDKAVKFIDQAIQNNPGNLAHWCNKVVILLKSGDGADAFRLIEEIPALYHDLDRVAHLRLAAQVRAIERLPLKAVSLADALIEQNENDFDSKYNKAVALVYAGQFGQAISLCKSILAKLPNDPLTLQLVARLESETNSRNLDLVSSGITVRFPVVISGRVRDIPISFITVGSAQKTTTLIAVAQVGIPEFPDGKTAAKVADGPRVALEKVKMAVASAKRQDAKMIFLPELSIPHELRDEVEQIANENAVWLVGGSRYFIQEGKRFNRSVLVTPDGKWFDGEAKIALPSDERSHSPDLVSGDALAVFCGTPVGKIAVLICFDFYEIDFLVRLRGQADVIFVPSANRDVERLSYAVYDGSSRLQVPIIASNATGFGTSHYGARCYVSEIEEKNCKTFMETTSKRMDDLFVVQIPDVELAKEYLAERPRDGDVRRT